MRRSLALTLACAMAAFGGACSPLIGLIVRSSQSGTSAISPGETVRGSTRTSNDRFTPSCGAPRGGGDRAYTFTPETSGTYRIDVNAGYDCVVAVFDAGGQSIACNDDTGSVSHSQLEHRLEAGEPYTIVVDGYRGATGSFTLGLEAVSLDAPTPPVPAGQEDVLVLDQSRRGDTTGHADARTPPCGARPGSPEQTWRFTPDASGRHSFSVHSDYDGVLAIYAAGSDQAIACNDDAGSTRASRISAELIAGQAYEVVVDGYHGASGSYTIVAHAEALAPSTGTSLVLQPSIPVRGDTRSGNNAHEPGCGSRPGTADQAWLFSPPATGSYRFHVDAQYDSVLAIYALGSSQPLDCNDDFGSTRRSRLTARLQAGQRYEVVVDGYGGSSGAYMLSASAVTSSGGGTIALSQPVTGNTGAGTDHYTPTCGTQPRSPDETWTFTVPNTMMYRIHVAAQFDSVLAVYSRTGTQLACNDDFGGTRASRIETSLSAGDVVHIVVDGYHGATGAYRLGVEPMSAGATPPAPTPPTPNPPRAAPNVEDITRMEARCASAPTLNPGALAGRLVAADGTAAVTCGGGGRGGESLYRVEVTQTSMLTVTATSPLRPALELRSGCSRGSTVIACVGPTDTRATTETVLSARLSAGETYFLIVDSQTAGDGDFTLETTITATSGERIPLVRRPPVP